MSLPFFFAGLKRWRVRLLAISYHAFDLLAGLDSRSRRVIMLPDELVDKPLVRELPTGRSDAGVLGRPGWSYVPTSGRLFALRCLTVLLDPGVNLRWLEAPDAIDLDRQQAAVVDQSMDVDDAQL